MTLWTISQELSQKLRGLSFGDPVTHVYNPLEYAAAPHLKYLERFGAGQKEVLFLGMNPGPWGMSQTGVPFGEVQLARDWMGLEGPVGRPRHEHPKRPVEGFACHRREVSGQRLWNWAKRSFGTPEAFFARFFVGNYCPLVFLEESGRNRTPDKLPAAEREPLFQACDEALRKTVEVLQPTWVIGIGRFAEKRAARALQGVDVRIDTVLHPSPASPAANAGWEPRAVEQLTALGILHKGDT